MVDINWLVKLGNLNINKELIIIIIIIKIIIIIIIIIAIIITTTTIITITIIIISNIVTDSKCGLRKQIWNIETDSKLQITNNYFKY